MADVLYIWISIISVAKTKLQVKSFTVDRIRSSLATTAPQIRTHLELIICRLIRGLVGKSCTDGRPRWRLKVHTAVVVVVVNRVIPITGARKTGQVTIIWREAGHVLMVFLVIMAVLLRFGSVFPVDVHVASQGLSVGEASLAVRAFVASFSCRFRRLVVVFLVDFVVLFARCLPPHSLFPGRFHNVIAIDFG